MREVRARIERMAEQLADPELTRAFISSEMHARALRVAQEWGI